MKIRLVIFILPSMYHISKAKYSLSLPDEFLQSLKNPENRQINFLRCWFCKFILKSKKLLNNSNK